MITAKNVSKENIYVQILLPDTQIYGIGQYAGEDAPNDSEMMWEKLVSRQMSIFKLSDESTLKSL